MIGNKKRHVIADYLLPILAKVLALSIAGSCIAFLLKDVPYTKLGQQSEEGMQVFTLNRGSGFNVLSLAGVWQLSHISPFTLPVASLG